MHFWTTHSQKIQLRSIHHFRLKLEGGILGQFFRAAILCFLAQIQKTYFATLCVQFAHEIQTSRLRNSTTFKERGRRETNLLELTLDNYQSIAGYTTTHYHLLQGSVVVLKSLRLKWIAVIKSLFSVDAKNLFLLK